MTTVLITLLTVISQISGALGSASAIQSIITMLIQIIPSLVGTISDLVPIVKNIIAALQSNDNITDEQWDQLDQLSASADKNFEDIASKFNPDGTPITTP